MTGPAPIPEDDLELSFEAVSFGAGEKESGESGVPASTSFSSSAASSSSSAVPMAAGTCAAGEAGGPGRSHRRRHSAGGTRYLQPHQDSGGGGTGLAARPRSGRNTRHSISGSLMPNQAKRHDKDPPESSGDGFIAPGEIVPTALVVKNIAFSVKKDQFLSMMEAEGIPKPYAFNYHYDNGVFRGLAFANYTTPEETEAVVAKLNGMDLAGRKLRAELKRAPPGGQAEKDRRLSVRAAEFAAAAAAAAAGSEGSDSAEQHPPNVMQRRESKSGQHGRHQRTKSRSDQDPDWREKSRSDQDPDWRDTRGHHLPPSQAQFQHYHHTQQHQHQQPHHNQQNNQRDGEENSFACGGPAPLSDAPHSREGSAGSGRRRPSRQQGNAGGGEEEDELDLDDPEVRGYYETILTWKQDRPKSPVLDFPPSLTSGQRKILHRIAAKLGLYHFSEGDNAERHIRIMRTRPRNDKAGASTSQRGSIIIQGPRSARNGDAPKPIVLCEGPALSRSPGGSAMSRSPMNRPSFKNPDSAQATFGPVRQPRGPNMANNFSARRTRLLSDDSEAFASTGSTASQLNPISTRFNLSPSSNPPSSGGSPLLHPYATPSLFAGHTGSLSATNTVPAATGGSLSQGVSGRGRRSLDANAPNFVPAS